MQVRSCNDGEITFHGDLRPSLWRSVHGMYWQVDLT